jgi:hypothetical protein
MPATLAGMPFLPRTYLSCNVGGVPPFCWGREIYHASTSTRGVPHASDSGGAIANPQGGKQALAAQDRARAVLRIRLPGSPGRPFVVDCDPPSVGEALYGRIAALGRLLVNARRGTGIEKCFQVAAQDEPPAANENRGQLPPANAM